MVSTEPSSKFSEICRAKVVFPEPAGPSIEIAEVKRDFLGLVLIRSKISLSEVLATFLSLAIELIHK